GASIEGAHKARGGALCRTLKRRRSRRSFWFFTGARSKIMTTRDEDEALAADPDLALSLVRDDPPFRSLRKIGLVPAKGLGPARRAVFFALLAWLPLAIWAWQAGRALPGAPGEPLLQHFGVQVRCLLAIPILILAQGFAHKTTTRLIPWFERSGV